MMDLIIAFFLISGAAFMLLAALGILRLPDLPTRMHSSTKAGALGAMLIMAGVVLGFADWLALARGLAIVLFIMATTPIAAHAIGRAGYFIGVPLWDGTIKDELRENYDSQTHGLRSDRSGDSSRDDDAPG
ncbi:MAG: monovalent cation/H(+) antiporter subunit G [Pseudomonadota bacterium]